MLKILTTNHQLNGAITLNLRLERGAFEGLKCLRAEARQEPSKSLKILGYTVTNRPIIEH